LLNGISSLAIKATAASLGINSLDEFLRDMQYITVICNDVVRKSLTAFKKNKSKDQNRPDSPKIKIKTEENYSVHIAMGEITKKITLSSREKSNQLTQLFYGHNSVRRHR